MKKLFLGLLVAAFTLTTYSCRETTEENVEAEFEEVETGEEDAGEEIEAGLEETGEEIDQAADEVDAEIDEEVVDDETVE